ncbi:hypothetical protein BH18ACI3_BH18ACI3_16860 [soil metagenome]
MEQIEVKRKYRRRSAEAATAPEISRFSTAIFILLCIIPVFSTIAFGAVDIWATGILSLFAAGIACLWTADAWSTGQLRFNPSLLQLPVLGLILIGCIQLLPFGDSGVSSDLLSILPVSSLSLDPYATRFFLVRLIILFVFFAAALTYINSRGRLQKVVLMVIIFGAAMAFFGILQRLASLEAIYGLRPTPQAIPFGPFVNQHHFAAFMVMTAGVTLGLLFGDATKKDKKALLLIAVVLMGIAVVLTGSRGGMISFLCMIGFVLAARFASSNEEAKEPAKLTSKTAFAVGIAILLLTIVVVIYLGGGEEMLRGIGLQQNQADITSGRLHFWSVGLQIFLANPILGAGFDAFGIAFTRFDSTNGLYRVEQAHNDYLQMLADAGILGFACVAAFIYLFFKRSRSVIGGSADAFRRGTAAGASAGCFGILVHSFFDFPLRTPSNTFFFLLLVVLATVLISNSKRDVI